MLRNKNKILYFYKAINSKHINIFWTLQIFGSKGQNLLDAERRCLGWLGRESMQESLKTKTRRRSIQRLQEQSINKNYTQLSSLFGAVCHPKGSFAVSSIISVDIVQESSNRVVPTRWNHSAFCKRLNGSAKGYLYAEAISIILYVHQT